MITCAHVRTDYIYDNPCCAATPGYDLASGLGEVIVAAPTFTG